MLRRLLASVLSVVFVICFTPCLLILSLLQTYLNPTFYYTDFLDFSYDLAITHITESTINKNDELLENFSEDEIYTIINETYDKELLRNTIVNFVYEIKNLDDQQAIVLSLEELQNQTPVLLENFTALYIENIPECEDPYEFDILVCKPSNISNKKIKDYVVEKFEKNYISAIPDNIEIKESDDHRLFNLLKSLNLYTKIISIGIISFLVVLLVIISLLVLKPVRKVMRYLSINLVIGAILTIITAFLAKNFFIYIQPLMNLLPEGGNDSSVDFLSFLISFFSKQLTFNSIIVLVVGLLLFAGSFLFKKKEKKESDEIKEDISQEIDQIISSDIEVKAEEKQEKPKKPTKDKSKQKDIKQDDKPKKSSSEN